MIRQRKPLKRKEWLQRSRSPLVSSARISRKEPVRKRRARVRTRNTKRRTTNWQRAYHSAARVAFVKSLPCAITGDTGYPRRVNAHTRTGGAGRKADYWTIIPLAPYLHELQHRKGWMAVVANDRRWSAEHVRDTLAVIAAETQSLWLAHAGREGLPR